MADNLSIFVVEHERTLGELIARILEEEGYAAQWEVEAPETFEHIRRARPALIILDLAFMGGSTPLAERGLLDALRADPVTAAIPVLATATSQQLVEEAAASYTTRATLSKPFNVDDLLGRVRAALEQPPLHANVEPGRRGAGVTGTAEEVLAQQSRAIMLAWVQRLRSEPPWRGRPDLDLGDIIDTAPMLAEAIVLALHFGDGEQYFASHPEALRRVRQHAVLRRAQNIPLEAVIREYTLLRDEIWNQLQRSLPAETSQKELFALERAVNYSLDRIIEATIPAYLTAPPDAMP